MFRKFLDDLIHMTGGELLVNYWWLWLIFVIIAVVIAYSDSFIKPKR
jgi:hypothetical protein